MTSVRTATSGVQPEIAIGGGILAGILTLAVVSSLLWFGGESVETAETGEQSRIGSVVSTSDLRTGDCINFTASQAVGDVTIVSCEAPHLAQVSAVIEHPDAGGAYPGADAITEWVGDQCATLGQTFLGTPVLETTLTDGALTPDLGAWTEGGFNTSCYVARADSTSLAGSVEGRGQDYPRGLQVPVSRLIEGDCFVPNDGTDSYDLNSNSTVSLVSCDGEHNGIFFGRATLDYPIGASFPGEDEVGSATSERCMSLFEQHFDVDASGFNYRYWRPNQQSWNIDDRVVLCAVLDAEPLLDRFDPSEYAVFFNLEVGECFNLGPEETSDSLRLDDQVRLVDCDRGHLGQMIGSGDLEADTAAPFPAGDGVLQLAGRECEQLFTAFVGESPYDSELGNFPFWYPNEPGWDEGDRRYACAFLGDEPRLGSLQSGGA